MNDKFRRNAPDITFVETDTTQLIFQLTEGYEMFVGRRIQKGDPVRLFILWLADVLSQTLLKINESAKQNLPRFATGEQLDALGEIFKDVIRLTSQPATTTLLFALSEPQPSAQTIPTGTRATADGIILFETTESLTIPIGDKSGSVKAVCQIAGDAGNGFLPGEIKDLVDVFPYYGTVSNTTISEGGADVESDDAYYYRMRESQEAYSTAGSVGAYIYHAKTVSPLITDVAADSPEPGIADIRILLRGGVLPDTEMIEAVNKGLSSDKVRPFTDFVKVSAPETIDFSIDFTYYIPVASEESALIIQSEVNSAVNEYKAWQCEKMGRDINPSVLIGLLMKTGIKRVDVRQPIHGVIQKVEVATLTEQNVINGGIEDE